MNKGVGGFGSDAPTFDAWCEAARRARRYKADVAGLHDGAFFVREGLRQARTTDLKIALALGAWYLLMWAGI